MQRLGCMDRSAGMSGRPANVRPTCYPAVSGGEESVVRLSLGKLLVNLLQVVKQTNNTPLD